MMDEEQIYFSVLGELVTPVPGVENAFAPGSLCDQLYRQMYEARCSVCQRLGVEEDLDVEMMLDSFFRINRELCLRMFRLGRELR